MPGLTKVWFEIDTLKELQQSPAIIGVKDSSGDLDYFGQLAQLKQSRPDWSIMIGPEHLLPEAMALGGDGGVAGGANVWPTLFVAYQRAAQAGSEEQIAPLRETVGRFQAIYEIGKYASRHIKATKCALSLLGICDDCMAEPFHRFHAPERHRVRAILEELEIGPLVD